ncbi:Uncharacterised protein [Vibrio cholerae]|uniref:Uncharacterized protein n=1 Tax=Vibrio cholerae TaxID=666 RepID=A0A655WSD1_VIBCL|nr:Uncharacterised protein [Vibrio cholerae]
MLQEIAGIKQKLSRCRQGLPHLHKLTHDFRHYRCQQKRHDTDRKHHQHHRVNHGLLQFRAHFLAVFGVVS